MKAAHAIVIAACAAVGMSVAVVWRARQWERLPSMHLSVFEPYAGGCSWYRHDVARGVDRPIARFQIDCASVQVAWAPGAGRALVWFSPEGFPSREDMLFEVDVRSQTPRRLPLPEPGDALTYLYDDRGGIHAFTEDQQVSVEPAFPPVPLDVDAGLVPAAAMADAPGAPSEPGWIEAEGRRFRASTFPEGQDVLVRALSLDQGGWRVEETRASRCCAEGAPGLEALDTYTRLTLGDAWRERQSNALLTGPVALAPIDAAPLLGPRSGRLPLGVDPAVGPWLRLTTPHWARSLLVRGTPSEPSRATGVAFFVETGEAHAIPGFTFAPADVVQPMERGPYLLVTDFGAGMNPHLYDMRTGQLVYSSQVAYATTFWPGD